MHCTKQYKNLCSCSSCSVGKNTLLLSKYSPKRMDISLLFPLTVLDMSSFSYFGLGMLVKGTL